MTVESDRRKLRQVYQQTKSRKRAVADARDGKKGGNSRQNNNNNNNNNNSRRNNNNDRNNNNRRNDRNEGSAPRRFIVSERVTRQHGFGKGGRQVVQSRARREEGSRRRFADKNVAKSGARARFSRAADSRQNNNNNNNGKKGKKADNNQPRFKRAAQTKQAKVQIRKNQQQQQKQKKDGKKKQDKPKQDKPKQAPLSLDQLDAQLAAYKN